jgi:hypothetical protein
MARSRSIAVCLLITCIFMFLPIFLNMTKPAMGYDLLLAVVIQRPSLVIIENKLFKPSTPECINTQEIKFLVLSQSTPNIIPINVCKKNALQKASAIVIPGYHCIIP